MFDKNDAEFVEIDDIDEQHGLTWESQVQQAFISNVNAAYNCFMALDMDKDKTYHNIAHLGTFGKIEDMLSAHKAFELA